MKGIPADRIVHVDSGCCGWCHDEIEDEDAVNDGVHIVCADCWFSGDEPEE